MSTPAAAGLSRSRRPFLAGALLLIAVADLAGQDTLPPGVRWPDLTGRGRDIRRLILLSEPLLRVGTAFGPEPTRFAGVVGAARVASGGVAVADAGNHRVLFFDTRGAVVTSLGRAGDGPGEFRLPRWLGRCADGSVGVFDGGHNRLTIISPAGQYVGSTTLPAMISFDRMLWCSGGDRVVMLFNQARQPFRRGAVLETPTALVEIRGPALDTVMRIGVQDYYFAQRTAGFSEVPLGRATLASANSQLIFVCANHDAQCRVLDPEGGLRGEFRVGLPRRRATPADWSRAITARVERESLAWVRKRLQAVLQELPPATVFPSLDEIQADAPGHLWVRTFDNFATPVATWMVLTSRGLVVGFVAMPRAFQLMEIGTDYLLGVIRDPEGVEQVLLHRFKPFTP